MPLCSDIILAVTNNNSISASGRQEHTALQGCSDMPLMMHSNIEYVCPAAGAAAAGAKPLDLGHILAGIPGNVPADEAESANSGRPALPDPFPEPATTPLKAVDSTAEGLTEAMSARISQGRM